MAEEITWVSQADALRLLGELGDRISQQGLSQYLKGHPEVNRQVEGRTVRIDWTSLRNSRATRTGRGPAQAPALGPLFEEERAAAPAGNRDPAKDELSARRARADTERAESDARRAAVLAAEAEKQVVNRDAATNAIVAAGIALLRAMEERRVLAVDEIRAAPDTREALIAMKRHEREIRTRFANALTDLAGASDPALAAAE